MEIKTPAKRLHRHAVPIVMIIAALLILSAFELNHYHNTATSSEDAVMRGLVSRTWRFKPGPNNLAKTTPDNFTSGTMGPATYSDLSSHISQVGRIARLSFDPRSSSASIKYTHDSLQ